MRTVRRALAVVFGIAGAVGLLLCVAGVVGCWIAYDGAVRRTDRTFGRAETALGDLGDELADAAARLRKVEQKWDAIRRQAPGRAELRSMYRKAIADASPQLADVRRILAKAIEIALVLDGRLDVLSEFPLAERIIVERVPVQDASEYLGELIARLEKLAATLETVSAVPDDGTPDELSKLGAMANRVAGAADAGIARAEDARERVRAWHAKVVRWIAGTAIGATVLLGWIGLGQLCLLLRSVGAVRRPVADSVPRSDGLPVREEGIATNPRIPTN